MCLRDRCLQNKKSGLTVKLFVAIALAAVFFHYAPIGTDVKNVQNGDDFKVYSALQENAFLIGFNGYSKALKGLKIRQAVEADIYTILSNALVKL